MPESIPQFTPASSLGAPSPPMPSAPHPNLLSYLGTHPELAGPPRHVGANSAVVGRVTLGRDAWLGAASVIRADGHYVSAGDDLTLGHGAAVGNPRHEAAVKFADSVLITVPQIIFSAPKATAGSGSGVFVNTNRFILSTHANSRMVTGRCAMALVRRPVAQQMRNGPSNITRAQRCTSKYN